jgi:hypothetical protein
MRIILDIRVMLNAELTLSSGKHKDSVIYKGYVDVHEFSLVFTLPATVLKYQSYHRRGIAADYK